MDYSGGSRWVAGELDLATGLEGDGTRTAGERDHRLLGGFAKGLVAAAGERCEQSADPRGTFVGNWERDRPRVDELLVLEAYLVSCRRALCGLEKGGKLLDRRNRLYLRLLAIQRHGGPHYNDGAQGAAGLDGFPGETRASRKHGFQAGVFRLKGL
jgi:hypothetical protein